MVKPEGYSPSLHPHPHLLRMQLQSQPCNPSRSFWASEDVVCGQLCLSPDMASPSGWSQDLTDTLKSPGPCSQLTLSHCCDISAKDGKGERKSCTCFCYAQSRWEAHLQHVKMGPLPSLHTNVGLSYGPRSATYLQKPFSAWEAEAGGLCICRFEASLDYQ